MTPGDINQAPRCDAFCPECNGDPQVQPCECCAIHRADMAQDRRCDDLPLASISRWMGPIALVAGFVAVVLLSGPYVKAFGEWMGAGW